MCNRESSAQSTVQWTDKSEKEKGRRKTEKRIAARETRDHRESIMERRVQKRVCVCGGVCVYHQEF